jgi:hypothetical protein
MSDVTQILSAIEQGDTEVVEEVIDVRLWNKLQALDKLFRWRCCWPAFPPTLPSWRAERLQGWRATQKADDRRPRAVV